MRRFYKIDPYLRFEKLEDFFTEPKIIRVNEFSEEALEDFEDDMDEAHSTGQPVIPIIIDTYGGSVYGAAGMIAAIEEAKVPVATIITSKAISAGAVLFCFGSEGFRFMHPHATMMIHDAATYTGGKVEDIKVEAKHVDKINQIMYKRVSKQIGQESNYIRKLVQGQHHVDWYLSAKEAKKHNIANHLRVPNFEIEITANVRFT